MQFQPLPTPLDVLKRIWSSFLDLLLVLGILLVMSGATQGALAAGGVIVGLFGHYIIGGIMASVAAIAFYARKSLRF